jgi:hypothetical protein
VSAGQSGRVYFHNGNNNAPYNAAPSFDLPVQSAAGAYASFGPGRGSSADWFGQPRAVYGTAFPNYGVLESMVMDSGQAGTAWQSAAPIPASLPAPASPCSWRPATTWPR